MGVLRAARVGVDRSSELLEHYLGHHLVGVLHDLFRWEHACCAQVPEVGGVVVGGDADRSAVHLVSRVFGHGCRGRSLALLQRRARCAVHDAHVAGLGGARSRDARACEDSRGSLIM